MPRGLAKGVWHVYRREMRKYEEFVIWLADRVEQLIESAVTCLFNKQ